MKKRSPVGIDNFLTVVDPENNYLFVDRTPLLKQIVQEGANVIALHAFRRMGKSLFASMLHHFFSPDVIGVSTHGMFDGLAISQIDPEFVKKYQGKSPVVVLSLKGIQAGTFEGALHAFHALMRDAYLRYPELRISPHLSREDQADIEWYVSLPQHIKVNKQASERSLKKLTELLFKHYGKKVWIIIDEYDSPLATAYSQQYFPELLAFMRNFLGDALKSNPYLEKGVLLGIVRLTKESILSGLNNPLICTLLRPYDYQPYFGFTEAEVMTLFNEAGASQDISQVRQWFNGYHIDGQELYNPWSIINCLNNKGELMAYWVNTANDVLLYDCVVNASEEAKAQFEQLVVQQKPVQGTLNEHIRFDQLSGDDAALWSLLYTTGYLTSNELVREDDGVTYTAMLRIPNKEVRGLYVTIFQKWLQQVFLSSNAALLRTLVAHDMPEFIKLIENYMLDYASVHHLKYEGCYHSLVLGSLYGLGKTHHVFSGTLESGLGFSDLLLIPKDNTGRHQALLIECKHTKEDETGEHALHTALAQIEQLQYSRAVKQFPYITSILIVGMAFYKKTVHWQAREELLEQ